MHEYPTLDSSHLHLKAVKFSPRGGGGRGSVCGATLPTAVSLKGPLMNAIRGPQNGQGVVESASDLLKGRNVGSMGHRGLAWPTTGLAQLQCSPRRVARGKLHPLFTLAK